MRGIILMNLGSPDSTSVKDVRRYLAEFLMDERVIDVPKLLRFLLVRGIIVPFRSPKSAKAYRSIWTTEGSPLIVISEQLREAVQTEMSEPVEIAMRYGNPSPKMAFDNLMTKTNGQLSEVVVVPLYPHYAMSSYETAVEYAKEIHAREKYPFALNILPPYYQNPDYLNALAESIRPFLSKNESDTEGYDHLLFSYHGIPERHIRKGDTTGSHCLKTGNCCAVDSPAHAQCYRHQCVTTTHLVAAQLAIPKEKYSFSFQSRLGQEAWLKPYTAKRLEEMPKEGIKNLLIVCPAFVSDCLETLEEINEEGREAFLEAGGTSFTMIPCLNVQPLWVKSVVKWARAGSLESKINALLV